MKAMRVWKEEGGHNNGSLCAGLKLERRSAGTVYTSYRFAVGWMDFYTIPTAAQSEIVFFEVRVSARSRLNVRQHSSGSSIMPMRSCRYHRHYCGQSALFDRHYTGTTAALFPLVADNQRHALLPPAHASAVFSTSLAPDGTGWGVT